MAWFDTHCHQLSGDDIQAAHRAGVARLVTVGTDAADSRAALEVAQSNQDVWATVGVHPHEARHGVEGIVTLLGQEKVVAVGECGLDYHYEHSPRPAQKDAFAAQVGLAHQWRLALVVHTREAWDDTFSVLRAEGVPERTVFHCFTGGPDEARRCLEMGAYLSFSGIITFKSADEVRAAAALCPLDRLLVETDAPYLAPVPHRGKRNQPALVPHVGAAVAAARGDDVSTVEEASWQGAHRAFALARPPTPT